MPSPITSRTFLAIALIASWALPACKSKQRSVDTTVVERLATRRTVVPRDTTILLPGESVSGRVPLPSYGVDLAPTTVRSGPAFSTVSITKGVLSHTGGFDSTKVKATVQDTNTETDHTKETDRTETITVTKTPQWAYWLIAFVALDVAARLRSAFLFITKPWNHL